MRTILIILTLVIWLILGWIYNKDYARCCAGYSEPSISNLIILEPAFVFDFNQSTPKFKKRWSVVKDSLAALIDETHKIEITGLLCPDEADSLGLSRAKKIRETFIKIPDENFIITTRQMACDSTHRILPFEAVDLQVRMFTPNIQEQHDKVLIYFPLNSTAKLNSEEVEFYLDNLILNANKTGSAIMLTGHTDNQGNQENNQKLGFQRATMVKNYLVEKGLPENRIKMVSLGQKNPINDNNNEAGRAKNRRVEISIIPSTH